MAAFEELVEIMQRLRGPDGCPWDQAQDFNSLTPYTIEESYELVASIEAQDWNELKSELGDLLFHIVFYAQIATEKGLFTIEDVAAGAVEKMRRRHPHVFGEATVSDLDALNSQWLAMKAEERQAARAERWDAGIPSALPALLWAYKLQQRAVNLGFEWPDINPVWRKLEEETQELQAAVSGGERQQIADEFGDILFTLVNLSRFLNVHPEQSLRMSCVKFRQRLDRVGDLADSRGLRLAEMTASELDALWAQAKRELGEPEGPP